MVRSARRTLGFASFGGPFLVVVTMSACTGGESDASPSTVPRIGATNYVTQPTVTIKPDPAPTLPPGGTTPVGQEYRVRQGDAVLAIADRYGISADELAAWNDWSDGQNHSITPGDVIRIPPFSVIPGAPTTTVPDTALFEGPICIDGTEQETYEVEEGDYLGRVAEELDVTVEQLDEANTATPGYASFYPGLEIFVPCSGDGSAVGDVPSTDNTG